MDSLMLDQEAGQKIGEVPDYSTPNLRSNPFWIALTALFLFIVVITLQGLGLKKAIDGLQTATLQVQWCAPVFQPFGVLVRDGNCNKYPIVPSAQKGIGCINLPGYEQKQWLLGTVGGTSVSIFFEVVDLAILIFVGSGAEFWGKEMRRPWATMISGVAILGVIFTFGIIYAHQLPKGINQTVWVVVNIDEPYIYKVSLISQGLRGTLIGWCDGLFSVLGLSYFGWPFT